MKPGDKYIIEIEHVAKTAGGELACIKGFRTLVFDQFGLDKLERYDDKKARKTIDDAIDAAYKRGWNECAEKIQNIKDAAYQNGLDDAWKIARLICMRKCDGGMGMENLEKVFGSYVVASIFHVNKDASDAVGKIRAWEKEKTDIHVGDEVKFRLGETRFVVTHIVGEHISGFSSDGRQFAEKRSCNWEKTGRHFDVSDLLEQMKASDVGADAPGGPF